MQTRPALIVLFGLLTAFSGCKKLDLEDIKPRDLASPFDMVCVGKVSESPYQNLVWQDEFEGQVGSSDPAECFEDDAKATCVERLDWEMEGACSQNISHLKKLNKCRWSIWDGFSFWEKSNNVAYRPSQIDVSGGKLKLKFTVRPDSQGPFNCGPTNRDPNSGNYYDRDCKVFTGGISSRYRANGKTPGRNIRAGRIEVKSRVRLEVGVWPAIWMWSGPNGDGYPYPQTPSTPDHIGELDLMEINATSSGETRSDAMQTYHVWHPNNGPHSQSGQSTPLDATQWNTYGVERVGDELKFYINGCFTRKIKTGDLDTQNQPSMLVDDTARFMILSLGITKEAALAANPNLNNAWMEVDYVRFYE